MEYVFPLLAVVLIGALVWGVTRWLGRSSGAVSERGGAGSGVGPDRAQQAAGLLDEDAHRTVYGFIATNRTVDAVAAYRRHTGRSLTEAVLDVQSLASHPQVHTVSAPWQDDADEASAPQQRVSDAQSSAGARHDGVRSAPETGTTAAEEPQTAVDADRAEAEGEGRRENGADASSDVGDDAGAAVLPDELTVPAEWTAAEPVAAEQHFQVEFIRPQGSVRLSSEDLSPWLRDQLAAMLRDGDLESAAVQLSSHTELSVPESFELLQRLRDEQR